MNYKEKRSAAKGRLTRAVKGLEEFIVAEDADDENAKKYFEDVEIA